MKIDSAATIASYSGAAVNAASSALFGGMGYLLLKNYHETYTGLVGGSSALLLSATLLGLSVAECAKVTQTFLRTRGDAIVERRNTEGQ